MAGDAVIDVAGLARRYRRVEAVREVTFSIQRGEVFGLLGPDGAGKSTIIQVLAGVLLPSGGTASVAGMDVLRDPEGVKARIGYMPQGLGLNLYDDLTVDEHLEFFAELRGVPGDQFREHRATLLEITRLAPAADRLARHLSGGMRQKLGLACALIHLPDVLLLDEPTTGVDPLSRQDFWHIINRLSRERQITVLLATPYLDEAERCHRVALLSRGRLLALGSPDELKARLAERLSTQAGTAEVRSEQIRMEDVFVSLLAAEGDGTAVPAPRASGAPPVSHRSSHGPAIAVEALTKRFGSTVAVNDISFTVEAGEIFGFLGPNGAGKTTAIKMLTGLLRPTHGRGQVAGYDILRQAGEIKHAIGYMSQRFSLYPDLTVGENLNLFARIYGLGGRRKRDREEEVIEAGGLDEWRGVLARDLPLGIRQRLALAGALLHEPPVLFLDEPTTGLDPRGRTGMWDVISGLVADGTTVLLTTQYLEEADLLANQIVVVDHGQVIARGTSDELKAQVGGERLEISVARGSDLDAALRALSPYASGDLRVDHERRRVVVPVTNGSRLLPSAVRDLDAAGLQLDDLALRRPTLDDVFLTLTGHAAEETPAAEPAPDGRRGPINERVSA